MPRQASVETRPTASPASTGWSELTRYRALTCAMPTRLTASSCDCAAGQPGVVADDRGDRGRVRAGHPVDPLAYRGLVGEVGLEHQPEGCLVVGDVGVEAPASWPRPAPCCRRWPPARRAPPARPRRRRRRAAPGRGRACPGSAGTAPAWTRRPARRSRPWRGVVALRDEHLECRIEQLGATRAARQASGTASGLGTTRDGRGSTAGRGARGGSVRQRYRLGHRCSVPTRGTPPGSSCAGGIIGNSRTCPRRLAPRKARCPRMTGRRGVIGPVTEQCDADHGCRHWSSPPTS